MKNTSKNYMTRAAFNWYKKELKKLNGRTGSENSKKIMREALAAAIVTR